LGVERFFEELRRMIANRIFSSLSELEEALLVVVEEYLADKKKVRRLCGYSWIIYQIHSQVSES